MSPPASPTVPTVQLPQDTNPSVLIDNYTTKYNIINSMETPALFGEISELPKGMQIIDKPVSNIDNYIGAYPITGSDIDGNDAQPCGAVSKTNGFYLGPDKTLGSNYFMQLGTCSADSHPECAHQDRYVYVKNIPTGNIPLLGNVSFESLTKCHNALTEGAGIIPGILEDISVLQPLNLLPNLFGNEGNFGSSTCQLLKLPVGAHIYDPQMKCELDYGQIPADASPEQRKQLTQIQVDSCVKYGENGFTPSAKPNVKSWWYEERCTPSINNAVQPTVGVIRGPVQPDTNVLGLAYDGENNESPWLPNAAPLFLTPLSAKTIPTLSPPKETFATTTTSSTRAPHHSSDTATRVKPQRTRPQRWSCTQYALVFTCLVLAVCCVVALCRAIG